MTEPTTTTIAPPAEEEAGIVGALLCMSRGTVDDRRRFERLFASGLTAAMFTSPTMAALWETGRAAHERDEKLPLEAEIVARMADVDPDDVRWAWSYCYGVEAAIAVAREVVARRERIRLVEGLSGATTHLADGVPIPEGRAEAEEVLAEPDVSATDPSFTVEDARAAGRPYDWVVPDFLERGNRLLITATEGAGKTELLVQLALQAAVGVHPWTLRKVPPVRTLYIDLELGAQSVARRVARLADAAGVHDDGRLRWVSRPGGLDLIADGGAFLARQLAEHPAELLCLGPLYQAHRAAPKGDIGGENQARELAHIFDRLCSRFGLAIILETHAPHAVDGRGNRVLRPFGSSVWQRWPDFGIALAPDEENPKRHNLSWFRGDRDERKWPTALDRYSKPWSWDPYWDDGMPGFGQEDF